MRIDVIKQLILGPSSKKDRFFKEAQELGVIEFIGRPENETNEEVQMFIDALHVLRTMMPVKQAHPQHFYSPNVLARQVIDYKSQLEQKVEQKRAVELEISRIAPFGYFSLMSIQEIEEQSRRKIQFFFAKSGKATHLPDEVIYVHSAHEIDYFISISKEKFHHPGLVEILFERSLHDLEHQLASLEKEIDHLEHELSALAYQKKVLIQGLREALNQRHLQMAEDKAQMLENGELFAVEAWIPKNKLKAVHKLADQLDIYIEPVSIEKKDRVPTYLENKGWGRLGEDLVNIYDTPSKSDRDPSLWVFIAFGIFFSMIVADLGYGLILLAICSFLGLKFRKIKGAGKRAIKLGIWLSIGCIIWGILLTSFFGIEVRPDSPLRKVSLIHWMVKKKAAYFIEKKPKAYQDLVKEYPKVGEATTPMGLLLSVNKPQEGKDNYTIYADFTNNVLIELSIFIGVIHIILSFLRYSDRSWSGFGWILFLIGGYGYFPKVIKATSLIYYVFAIPAGPAASIGLWLLYGGIALAGILAFAQHRWAGLIEPMHVISVFADVMSYLRIYALSLAGMIMATTFDTIGIGMPLYIGVFVILVGHIVNITLALMGGVIHGLRLNFIEWYHYSFEGGGRQFRPLFTIKEENT